MRKSLPVLPLAIVFILLSVLLSVRLNSKIGRPFPPFSEMIFDLSKEFGHIASYSQPLGATSGFRDFAGPLLGLRRLIADIAWIAMLQYYGGPEIIDGYEYTYEGRNFGGGKYYAIKKMAQRIGRIDPTFHMAYLYGAGALAFNLDRPQEAMELLEEGIQKDPTHWKYRLYIGAIIYKQKGEFEGMIQFLEDAVRTPDHPVMIKSILANIYADRKNYKRALELWILIAEDPRSDDWYQQQAAKNIEKYRKILGI